MSETASFVDPVFLARFGLFRVNALDYFMHPLNPFKSKTAAITSNEVLAMQGIGIGTIMQQGTGARAGPLSPEDAEYEYAALLTRLTGEQYELLPEAAAASVLPDQDPNHPNNNNANDPANPAMLPPPSPLFAIRHVLRTNPTTVKVLGVYYILEGVIYKSPTVRSLMKSNVTRTVDGLMEASDALSVCARYEPSQGYTWKFDPPTNKTKKKKRQQSNPDDEPNIQQEQDDDDDDLISHLEKRRLLHSQNGRKRFRRVLDHRRPGEHTEEEEEGIRAKEAIDAILVRLSKSQVVVGKANTEKQLPVALATANAGTEGAASGPVAPAAPTDTAK